MLQTEFIRSMNTNFERVLLDKQPEERRYQYCILSRGGIRGLLPVSLRYLDGKAYLYYDITSKQNVAQLFGKRCITREWLKDFIWNLGRIRQELARFLLDEQNIIWYPEQVFQDLESNIFSFLYVPYCEEENGFRQLMEYLVERIDYEDELLVECVYKMYEQYERNGEVYLQEQIYEDVKMLDKEKESVKVETKSEAPWQGETMTENISASESILSYRTEDVQNTKRGFRSLWEGKKRKDRKETADYRQSMEDVMEGYAVAEETSYGEEFGETIYIEDVKNMREMPHRLYTRDGRIVIQLERDVYTIGKKKNEVDLVLEDFAVSRMHARISKEQEEIYLEDLNSTNGTFKNGVRMQPYEKTKLEVGDDIKIGKTELIYR